MDSNKVIIGHRRGHLHAESIEWDHPQFIDHKNYLKLLETLHVESLSTIFEKVDWFDDFMLVFGEQRPSHILLVWASELKIVALNADEHVDDVEDSHWGGIGAVKIFLTYFTKAAFDRVEPVWHEIVGIGIDVVAIKGTLQSLLI